jgi:hypothetical protein
MTSFPHFQKANRYVSLCLVSHEIQNTKYQLLWNDEMQNVKIFMGVFSSIQNAKIFMGWMRTF